MEFYLRSVSTDPYTITAPESLPSPGLVLFRDRFAFNIKKMGELLNAISPGFGFGSLWPHVKTHKSAWVTQKLMAQGFHHFKASPNEVDMLIGAGVETIFIAYPLVGAEVQKMAGRVKENPRIQFIVQVSQPAHVASLSAAAHALGIRWDYFIDLDVGMHRTGIPPEKAFDLYRTLAGRPEFRFAGLHGYDGHNAALVLEERRNATRASVDLLIPLFKRFEKESIRVPKLMMGGTPSFLTDLEYLSRIGLDTDIILSPGTWVFFDSMDHAILPGTFQVAACILAQVMDRPGADTATLNLGYKRWAVDQGAIEVFSIEGMRATGWSEEHTVVSVPEGTGVDIGDYILIAPRHVCSTVNLWEHFAIIGPNGDIENPQCPIEGRNR